MKPFFAIVKKELASVLRDRTIIISVLIQFFIASFSSGLLLGMLSLYDADTILAFGAERFKFGVITSTDNGLAQRMSERGLQIYYYSTLAEAQDAFYSRKILAIIDAPKDANGLTEIKIYLPESEAASSLIRMVIQEPLKQYENDLRAKNGIETRYTDLKGEPATSFEFIYSILLPMLMFFPAFVSGSMTVDSLTEEIENKTLQTLLSTPIGINRMLFGKIASSVILALIQCAAWIALLDANDIEIQNKGWILALAAIVSGITSAAAAMGATLLQDRERSQFIYSLILLAAASASVLLDISPITIISRLAIGDAYTNGWQVALFASFFAAISFLLTRTSRRLTA